MVIPVQFPIQFNPQTSERSGAKNWTGLSPILLVKLGGEPINITLHFFKRCCNLLSDSQFTIVNVV